MRWVKAGIFALVLVLVVGSVVATAKNNFSRNITDNYEEIPDFGQHVIEKLKNNNNVIAIYGKIPDIQDKKLKKEWLSILDKITDDIRDGRNLDSYFYPKGPIIAYGHDYRGFIRVSFKKGSNVKKDLIDGVYSIFNEKAKSYDIYDVPVVFMFEDLPKVEARDSYWRPIIGGIQVQVKKEGVIYESTLGFSAINYYSERGYVVSGHFGDTVGLQIWQPEVSWRFWYKAGKVAKVGGRYSDAS